MDTIKYSQNFIKSPALVENLIDMSSINKNDTVLEIGPGKGKITQVLVQKARKVIAIEKDADLYFQLKDKFQDPKNLYLINKDILNAELPKEHFKVFANIPFNITADIIRKLTDDKLFLEACLIVQKEAAERFIGKPESQLSIVLKPWFQFEIVYDFDKNDFTPVPSVDCVLLKITRINPPLIDNKARDLFNSFVFTGFNKFKPTLKQNFRNILSNMQFKILAERNNFDVDAKPTDLNLGQWIAMFEFFQTLTQNKKVLVMNTANKYLKSAKRVEKINRTRNRPALPNRSHR